MSVAIALVVAILVGILLGGLAAIVQYAEEGQEHYPISLSKAKAKVRDNLRAQQSLTYPKLGVS